MDRLLDIRRVSDRLCVSIPTTYRLIHAGRLKALKTGVKKGYRVRETDLIEYMRKRDNLYW